jgi:hypothetical protein
MRRLALAGLATAALVAPAAAQLGNGLPECQRSYKEFWSALPAIAVKELTGAQLAAVHRYALRGYDGCTSGDQRVVTEDFFKRLAAIRAGKTEELFRQLDRSLPAK